MTRAPILCAKCGELVEWAGNGRPPKFCPAHRKAHGEYADTDAAHVRRKLRRSQQSKARAVVTIAQDAHRVVRLAAGLRVHPADPSAAAAYVGLDAPDDLDALAELARGRYGELITGDTNAMVRMIDSAIVLAASKFVSEMASAAPGMMPGAMAALGKLRSVFSGNAPASFSAFKLVLVDHDGAELDLTPEPDRKAG